MTALRLSAFYGVYFMFIGVLMPYWPVWLDARGLGAEQIGLVLAAGQWVKIVMHPLVATVADRAGRPRTLTAALAAIACGTLIALDWITGFEAILILAVLGAAVFGPILSVGESIANRAVIHHGIDYGRVRLWGSITFIAATTGLGFVLEDGTVDLIRVALVMLSGALILACLALPSLPEPRPTAGRRNRPWALLVRADFLLFLGIAGGLQASHAVLYSFATIEWRAAGIDETVIGLLWAWGVVAEIALLAVAGRFGATLTPRLLFALAGLAACLRWSLMVVVTDPWLLFPLQTLHAFTFGAAHLGAMRWLRERVPEDLSATGQSLYYALVGGVITGASMSVAGSLYAAAGADAYWAMAALGAAALLGTVMFRAR